MDWLEHINKEGTMAVKNKVAKLIYLEKEQDEVVTRVAKIVGMSGSKIIRKAIDMYLDLFVTYLEQSKPTSYHPPHQNPEEIKPTEETYHSHTVII